MRSIVIVLDSFGIGNAPDADAYGDMGTNTFLHIWQQNGLELPNMRQLGIYDTINVSNTPLAAYAIGEEHSFGKDSISGHWELMGCITQTSPAMFPNGFPPEIVTQLEQAFGRKILANIPASGTEIINQYGNEHIKTGYPIVYTSADSVLQIAAHVDVIPLEQLYKYCEAARIIMTGKYAVDRVIARPFRYDGKRYVRTADRKDYSLLPPTDTVLDIMKAAGKDVIGIGKITDIFSGRGITESQRTHSNSEGIAATIDYSKKVFNGLLFVNLVDFDMEYGHRNDVEGYSRALLEFDNAIPEIQKNMTDDDILIITADHGCDPTTPGTDHTREHVPILMYGKGIKAGSRGIVPMSCVGATIAAHHGLAYNFYGKSLLSN